MKKDGAQRSGLHLVVRSLPRPAERQTFVSSIKDSEIHQRECLMSQENPYQNSLFQTYYKETCQYDCICQKLLGETNPLNISCIPWDIPQNFDHTGKILPICVGQKLHDFKAMLAIELQEGSNICSTCIQACHFDRFFLHFDVKFTDSTKSCRNKDFFDALQVIIERYKLAIGYTVAGIITFV